MYFFRTVEMLGFVHRVFLFMCFFRLLFSLLSVDASSCGIHNSGKTEPGQVRKIIDSNVPFPGWDYVRIHGTNGIFTYMKTIQINHLCR